MAVLLGMKARASIDRRRAGCGACDIDVPPGPGGAARLLVALVAGGAGEGRLIGHTRTPRASTDDARAMLRLLGGLDRPGVPERIAVAKAEAERLVRDRRVWRAIGAVARALGRHGAQNDGAIRAAVLSAGLTIPEYFV